MTDDSWPPPVRGTSEIPASPGAEAPRPASRAPDIAPVAPVSRHERYRDADYDDGGREEGPRQRGKFLVPVLAGALALAVLVAATFAILWVQSSKIEPEDINEYISDARTEVEPLAEQAVDLLMNYDSTNLEQRRSEMLAIATGEFREDYDDFTSTLGRVLREADASSRGDLVDDPRISFSSASEAVAIMRTTQTTQSSENPTGQTILYNLRVTLIDTSDGGWKVDGVEILSEERS